MPTITIAISCYCCNIYSNMIITSTVSWHHHKCIIKSTRLTSPLLSISEYLNYNQNKISVKTSSFKKKQLICSLFVTLLKSSSVPLISVNNNWKLIAITPSQVHHPETIITGLHHIRDTAFNTASLAASLYLTCATHDITCAIHDITCATNDITWAQPDGCRSSLTSVRLAWHL